MNHRIYLDHNATTPIHPRAAKVVAECYQAGYVNPASQHAAGRAARKKLEQARTRIAEILGIHSHDPHTARVIFTSGGTESNNLALHGMAGDPPGEILVSAIEHPSVLAAAQQLAHRGFAVRTIPVSPDGIVNLETFQDLISQQTRLVSVMLGNNETGAVQPVAEIASICRQLHVPMHTDAVQAVGKVPVDFGQLGIQAMSLTAHKFHGPRGIGALVIGDTVEARPLLVGGSQQLGIRPGTESVALACGMSAALEWFAEEAGDRPQRLARWRDRFERGIMAAIAGAVVHCAGVDRLPHTSNISFPPGNRQALLMALDRAGIDCSTGSACVSGSSEPSHVLAAMGCETALIESSLRFSLAATTQESDLQDAIQRIVSVVSGQKRHK